MVDRIHLVNWGIIMTGELFVGQSWPFLHTVTHTLASISMAADLANLLGLDGKKENQLDATVTVYW